MKAIFETIEDFDRYNKNPADLPGLGQSFADEIRHNTEAWSVRGNSIFYKIGRTIYEAHRSPALSALYRFNGVDQPVRTELTPDIGASIGRDFLSRIPGKQVQLMGNKFPCPEMLMLALPPEQKQ